MILSDYVKREEYWFVLSRSTIYEEGLGQITGFEILFIGP